MTRHDLPPSLALARGGRARASSRCATYMTHMTHMTRHMTHTRRTVMDHCLRYEKQPHLNNKYTVFARVIDGNEVL